MDLQTLAAQTGAALLQHGETLACVESCTGGWIAKALTDIPGSSAYFERGFITYSNAAKQDMVGVRAETLARHGAVSEAVVLEMAEGGLAHSAADWSLAVSGIAGPGGGSAGKPVGTVCFAWASRAGRRLVHTRRFSGDREAVRRASVEFALQTLLSLLAEGRSG
jgi:nicotinamide-nucleotide amidase